MQNHDSCDPDAFDWGDDDDIEGEFPFLAPLTHVRTSADNRLNIAQVPDEIYQYERKWRIAGMVTDTVKGEMTDWYEILHVDGTVACYHYTELLYGFDIDADDTDDNDDMPVDPPVRPNDARGEWSQKGIIRRRALEPARS